MDMRLGGSLWHFVVPIVHIPGISFCMAMQSKDMVGRNQSLCTFVEAFGVGMEVCGVVHNNKLIVAKKTKARHGGRRTKQLKSELAALDRKIQLELVQPMPESTEENRQGSEKKQTEQQPETTHGDFVRSHLFIGRLGLTEPKGMKL